MENVFSEVLGYLPLALEIVGATALLVGIIAKSTATDSDDKLAALLSKLHDFLAKFVLSPSVAEKKAGEAVVKSGAAVVFTKVK